MTDTLNIADILSAVYSGFLLTGGLLCIFLRPMEDEQELSEAVVKAANIRYIRMRYISGICFIILAIIGYSGISPAVPRTAGAYPLCITMLFVLYAEMILAMCEAEHRRSKLIHRMCLLIPVIPLAILVACMPDSDALVYIGWVYFILLAGVYTMRFFSAYKYLNDCCCNTIELGADYDILPDSMPWVAHLYLGAVMLAATSALFSLVEWGVWLSVAAHSIYFTWFINRFLYTYPLLSKALAHYQMSSA